jgi:phage shock protein PspC (stress-responsive transcriptional regulator)
MTRQLTRSPDRMLGGVCAGIADYAGLDVTLVRIIVVLGTIFGFGSFLLIYLIGWVLIPSE